MLPWAERRKRRDAQVSYVAVSHLAFGEERRMVSAMARSCCKWQEFRRVPVVGGLQAYVSRSMSLTLGCARQRLSHSAETVGVHGSG